MRGRVSDGQRRLRRWLRGLSLLPAVCLAIAGGVAIALLATWILRSLIHTSSKPADPIDITKLSFTVAGGVGAAVALVVAYRRQRDIEQGRFVERFGAAAAQLGDHDVAVRIAGVYAMAGVADESTGLRRQQCIDVLCGYLRLPYSPELGSNHQSKLVLTESHTGDDGSSNSQQERHLEFRQNDKEVRATIVRVIGDHLRDHEYSWSTCDFDFRSAQLQDVDLSRAVFGGTARFNEATFAGDDTRFNEAKFSGDASFGGATSAGTAWFIGAAFAYDTWFGGATFAGDAWFGGATFAGTAWFKEATFAGTTSFIGATFAGDTWFMEATFAGDTRFNEATFSYDTSFNGARFSGDTLFDGARFAGSAWFKEATFAGPARFAATDFGSEPIAFENPRQWGPPPPTFDWDDDFSKKPKNVTPHEWPPTPID
ncbi:MAG: pentapeptide repeat-containing protein [Mycobacterium sp.]